MRLFIGCILNWRIVVSVGSIAVFIDATDGMKPAGITGLRKFARIHLCVSGDKVRSEAFDLVFPICFLRSREIRSYQAVAAIERGGDSRLSICDASGKTRIASADFSEYQPACCW